MRSHLIPLQLITDSVILTIHTQLIKQSYLQNTKTNIVLHNFGAVRNVTPRFPNLKILAQNQSKQLNRMLHFFKIQL